MHLCQTFQDVFIIHLGNFLLVAVLFPAVREPVTAASYYELHDCEDYEIQNRVSNHYIHESIYSVSKLDKDYTSRYICKMQFLYSIARII